MHLRINYILQYQLIGLPVRRGNAGDLCEKLHPIKKDRSSREVPHSLGRFLVIRLAIEFENYSDFKLALELGLNHNPRRTIGKFDVELTTAKRTKYAKPQAPFSFVCCASFAVETCGGQLGVDE